MRCGNCDSNMDKKWRYCPACGQEQERDAFEDIFDFGGFFRRMNKEFQDFERTSNVAEKEMEIFNLVPEMKKSRVGGFSISITRQGDGQPKVSVRTFGDFDKKDVEKSLKITAGGNDVKFDRVKEGIAQPGAQARTRSMPKTTEEPKTQIKRAGDRITVEIELPGVSEKKIEIKKLTESVEIKAVSKGKAFFKILTFPQGFELSRKEFKDGKLRMEFLL